MAEYAKRGYLLESFRLFHLHSLEHAQVDYHYHEFCKLLLLVSGSGDYVVDGQRYRLQAGDAVLIGSRSVHRPELENGVPYERIIIYISPEFLQKASTPECELTDCFSGSKGHVLRPGEKSRKQLFAMAAALEHALSGEEYGRTILGNALLLQLLVAIGRQLRRTDAQNPHPVVPQNRRVLDMMHYMDTHFAQDLDIDMLAEEFYISKYHMMRLFRRQTGMTVYEYLTQRRLLWAREQIESGLRATEACYRSGFRSYSSFTRAYGKHFGTTPTGRREAAHERVESYE